MEFSMIYHQRVHCAHRASYGVQLIDQIQYRGLVRNRDAQASKVETRLRSRHENHSPNKLIHVVDLKRHVDEIKAGFSERRVMHRWRRRMSNRTADDSYHSSLS